MIQTGAPHCTASTSSRPRLSSSQLRAPCTASCREILQPRSRHSVAAKLFNSKSSDNAYGGAAERESTIGKGRDGFNRDDVEDYFNYMWVGLAFEGACVDLVCSSSRQTALSSYGCMQMPCTFIPISQR